MLVLKPQFLCCLLYSGDAYMSSLEEGKGWCACTQFTCHLKKNLMNYVEILLFIQIDM